jgi:ABC-2 type transport system ATP-binding protein
MNNELVIEVKDLKKTFAGKVAVHDACLQVKKGDIFGFLGPNGSGKTTTLRMLCGLLQPDSGNGTCLGYDVLHDSDKIRLRVGYMTQKFSLYENLTVKENLDFVASVYQIKNKQKVVQDTIAELGLEKRKNQLAGSLSGGWKQRLALSASMLHQPDLLLLDEPTAGVDPQARRDFWEYINHLSSQGVTTLVTTHYMDEAERCTYLAYMAYGNMLASGTRREIIDQSRLVTYSGSGEDLFAVEGKLRQKNEAVYVSAFGNSVHVSGTSKDDVLKAIQEYPDYNWHEIDTSLEDVFISMADCEDTR